MLEHIPNADDMISLIGQSLFDVWQKLCAAIDESYEMEKTWNSGGKRWTYEYKYRRGGKTLCALYAKENRIGFMVIFGQSERLTYEKIQGEFSDSIQRAYHEAVTYHDGKWVMFEPDDPSPIAEYIKLLSIKRKPNRNK